MIHYFFKFVNIFIINVTIMRIFIKCILGEERMEDKLKRYSFTKGKFPREVILIQGKGCRWKRCTFCDYHNDVSENPFEVNLPAIESILGITGVLDVSNSGSAMEIDPNTLECLIKKVKDTNIHTVWFEAHWIYRKRLTEFSKNFPGINVKFRMGAETFDPLIRKQWNKGIPDWVSPEDIAIYYNGVSLLVGLCGQSIQSIEYDIKTADKYFEYFSLNVFNENTTNQKQDNELVKAFIKEVYPKVVLNAKADILIKNTDWGIG